MHVLFIFCFPPVLCHVQYVKDEKLLKALGKRIRELRKKRNLTQVELGVKCNNYAEQIGRIERGELNVTISSLNIIARALQVSLSELVTIE
ncbi:MAG: helix-turn-helix transcriptional regulator [Bacteroidetes bacterium]|nr:helix-turn-helix transcriptional regulator [Bacteroidota bacterium]